MFFLKMAAVRHLGFKKKLNFLTVFRVQRASIHQRAKFCRNQWNRCSDIAIYPFSRWRLSAILDLWGKFWHDPQSEFGGLYHCAKLVRIASVVLIIQKFECFDHLA